MTNIINKHNFINKPEQKFISDQYEMTGKFTNIDFDLSDNAKLNKLTRIKKPIRTNKPIRINKPIKTKGTYLINDVQYPINLGSVIALDDKAVSKLQQQATNKHHDFNCVIEPNTSIGVKGDIALHGRTLNGHYVSMKQARHHHVFYNQIKDIELDPNGATKSLDEIDANKPVQLRGKIEIYDHSKTQPKQEHSSYGTHPIQLGTITPQDDQAASSLTDTLANHDLNLIIDKTSDVKFAGEHVPTGVVTNHSHVVLDEEARMNKVLISNHSTINITCGRLTNSILLGTDAKDIYMAGYSEVTNSIIDAKVRKAHDKHTQLNTLTDNDHNFRIINSKIFGPSSLTSSWIENSKLYSQPHSQTFKSKTPEYAGLYDYSSITDSTLAKTDAIRSRINSSKLLGSLAGIMVNKTNLNNVTFNHTAAVLDDSLMYDVFVNKDLTCENSAIRLNRYAKYDKVLVNTPIDAKNIDAELGFENGIAGMTDILSERNGFLSYTGLNSKTNDHQFDLANELNNKLYQVPQAKVDTILKLQDKFKHVSSKAIDELDQHARKLYNQHTNHKANVTSKTKDTESFEL